MVYPDTNLQNRVKVLRWIIPIGLLVLSVGYQLGPARWVHDRFDENTHFLVEILFYGFVGPTIVFLAFDQIKQWLLDKEEAEQVARSTQLKLAAITEASADAIIGIRPDGKIESWNRGAELILGHFGETNKTMTFSALLAGKENSEIEWNWLAETVQKTGFIRGYETACRSVDGESVLVELTATHMTNERGKTTGFSVIMRDITERKRREAEIHELNTHLNELVNLRTQELDKKIKELANANARLKKLDQTRSEFVSLVSHQIRAPLTNIRGAVEKMQGGNGDILNKSAQMLDIIDQQAERLDKLVRDVLNAHQIETGHLILQKEPVSILPLIEQAVDQLRSRNQTQNVTIPVKPGLPLVYSDSDRILEIMANLLDNAAKYSPSDSEIQVNAYADQSEITISIKDFGSGISTQDVSRIFEKFYRSDSSDSQIAYGYGLGLYICRRLVEALNGKIWAENHPEGGAVFSFTLPIWQEFND